ncbi:MAG: Flp pilus assembly protein CpaB [Chloroflexota bacterium]
MNRRALILVITGLAAAVVASLVVYYLITNVERPVPQSETTAPTPLPQRQVVIAATDIPANSVITDTQVTTASYPVDLVPADAITSTDRVVNSTAKSAVFSGQILLQRQFVDSAGHTGASINIPPGKVLIAFPSTDMLNATGAVQPGDHVDIMISLPISGTTRLDQGSATQEDQLQPGERALVAQVTLQNIEVYTSGVWTPPGQQNNTNTDANANAQQALKIITFIVDHQEALILKYVKDSGGTIDLAVRSAADNQNVQTDPVTLDYLVDLYGFIGLAAPAPKP